MKRTPVALTSVLLVAFAQSVLAQSAIETALQATVTIEVTGPDGRSHGSGFITSSDGIIITAAHVIDGATSAVVRLQNGEELNVEGVIAIDRARDFAILRVAGFDLPTVPLGNADDLSAGQRVIVIGAPMDAALAGTISDGLLAADRLIAGTRTLQISAPTSPGNSGGPVLTEEGQVIGLVVSGINAEGAENLNFALPINYVRGQLALAATQPLQALAEVPATTSARVTASAGVTRDCSTSAEELGSLNSRVEQGDAVAQAELGSIHGNGDCVPQDYVEAVRWLRLAAEQGNARGQAGLGYAYANGLGVPEDDVEAVRWYRLAAEQRNVRAQSNLGYHYGSGQGVPEDDAEAVRWYRLAADQGSAYSQRQLGYHYANGLGVPEDDAEAVRWYRVAAEQGDAVAQAELGVAYGQGLGGVPEDIVEAVRWSRLAAEQGHAGAQTNLGRAYGQGQGVPEDDVEAVRWLRLAAEQGHAGAQDNLGYAYGTGQGVPEDDVLAYMWFNIAAAQGNESARGNKDIAEQQMTREQITEAQRLTREWLEAHPPGGN